MKNEPIVRLQEIGKLQEMDRMRRKLPKSTQLFYAARFVEDMAGEENPRIEDTDFFLLQRMMGALLGMARKYAQVR